MIENELTKKLREELDKQAGENPFYKHIADFIYHAVTTGNHIDVMNDIAGGKYTVEGAFEAAQEVAEENGGKNARCAVLDAPTVYGIVAEYLGLKDCISGEGSARSSRRIRTTLSERVLRYLIVSADTRKTMLTARQI